MPNRPISDISPGHDHQVVEYRSELISTRRTNRPNDFMRQDESRQTRRMGLESSSSDPSDDPVTERLRLEIQRLTLQNQENERQRRHDMEMLQLRNQHESEMSASRDQHELAMRNLDLEILRVTRDENRRREESLVSANNERALMTATVVEGGIAAAAGAVLGAAAYVGAAGVAAGAFVGAAAVAAPVTGAIAIVSGYRWASKKAAPASIPRTP